MKWCCLFGDTEHSILFFLSIFVNGIIIYPSFQTTNLAIAWDSILSLCCWVLLNVSWILLPLLAPTLKTGLSSFLGGPAFGLCLLQFIFLTAASLLKHLSEPMACKPDSLAHHSLCLLHCSSVPGHFSPWLFVHAVNCGLAQLSVLFYPEGLWLILPDLDLMSALQWTLSWPSGRISCFTISVPITYHSHLLDIWPCAGNFTLYYLI